MQGQVTRYSGRRVVSSTYALYLVLTSHQTAENQDPFQHRICIEITVGHIIAPQELAPYHLCLIPSQPEQLVQTNAPFPCSPSELSSKVLKPHCERLGRKRVFPN